MKSLKFKFVIMALFALGLSVASCGNKSDKAESTEQTDQQGKEYTSAYVCPMHCKGSGSDQAGKCPECGMDYVKNEKHNHDGHNHDGHNHDGHNHDGHNHDGHDHEGHSH